MSKSWAALALLPLVAACAGTTPGTQTAAVQCKMVQQDATESIIKVKKECTPAPEGTSGDNLHQETRPAPQ